MVIWDSKSPVRRFCELQAVQIIDRFLNNFSSVGMMPDYKKALFEICSVFVRSKCCSSTNLLQTGFAPFTFSPSIRPVLMVTEYSSEKSAHALSELENVKKLTVMGTKGAPKKVEVNRVYFRIFEMSK